MDPKHIRADRTGGRPIPSMILTPRPVADDCRGGGTTLGRCRIP